MRSFILVYALWIGISHASDKFHGRATTYGLDDAIGGSCSVRMAPMGLDPRLFVAMNGDQYDSSAACSRCLTLSGPSGTVQTFVADICHECGENNLDLNTALWDTVIGGHPRIEDISWQYSPCPEEQEKFCQKEGSNPQWMALQVANSRDGIQEMEIDGKEANVIGVTSFYQVSAENLNIEDLKVKIKSNTGMTSKFKLSTSDFDGCSMPNGGGQDNDTPTTTSIPVDVTGATPHLNAWRSYRRRRGKLF